MAFLDHNGESEFPFNKDSVFTAMCEAIPHLDGMKIDNADKLSGRILVKAGVSLYSWGENIPIQLTTISENLTKVSITSSPKTGMMFGGAFDMGKNRKNIERILQMTSNVLSTRIQTKNTPVLETHKPEQLVNTQNLSSGNITSQYNSFMPPAAKKWYHRNWLVVFLCFFFFPVGLYGLWKSNTFLKAWKIIITTFIAFMVIYTVKNDDKKATIAATSKSNKISEEATPISDELVKEKEWTKVYSFSGNGLKKSPAFELSGNDARIRYSYKAPGGLGMGLFSVYVVNEGDDIMKTGGMPEIMTQAENEESESTIQKSSGRYYLEINASGSWTVTIEELK